MADIPDIPVHPQATRRLVMRFDKNGNPVFDSVLSPESFAPRALCILPKRHVIPVIFVPGIMGSNLRATARYDAKQPPAWRPPNGTAAGLGEWFYRFRQDATARQKQLTPEHCEVDPTGPIELSDSTYTLDAPEASRRGWGELHWDSYGEILLTLEKVLNDQYESSPDGQASRLMPVWELAKTLTYPAGQKDKDGNPLPTDALKRWNKVAGGDCPPLTDDEIARLDDYYYPVWACGYNWLESNANSAKRLVQRIQDVLKHYSHPDCKFIPEGRVILVTHSMGGAGRPARGSISRKGHPWRCPWRPTGWGSPGRLSALPGRDGDQGAFRCSGGICGESSWVERCRHYLCDGQFTGAVGVAADQTLSIRMVAL